MFKLPTVRVFFIILTWMYILGLLLGLHSEISTFLSNPIVAILALIGIIKLSYEDLYLTVLLGIALILSIHMSQFNILSPRTKLYSSKEWNDIRVEEGPMGFNLHKQCNGFGWCGQCQGMETQGFGNIQGFSQSAGYNAANF